MPVEAPPVWNFFVPDLRIEGLLQIGTPDGDHSEPAVIELTTAQDGGGFLVQGGELTLDGVVLSGNEATAGSGGGLGNRGVQMANSDLDATGTGSVSFSGTGAGTGSCQELTA